MNPDVPTPAPSDAADSPDDSLTQSDADNVVDSILDTETQKRLWLRSIVPLLQSRKFESDPSGRVQLAFDMMHIAACERVARIMRSDLDDGPADA
jgi:hypothetical protein